MEDVKELTAEKDFYKASTRALEKKLNARNKVYEELLREFRTANRVDKQYWRYLYPVVVLAHAATSIAVFLAVWRFW